MKLLFKPTVVVSAFNFVALIISFACQLIVAATFGTRAQMDAYLAASALPTVIAATLSGPVAFVLIPAIMRRRSSGGLAAGWQVASGVLNLAALGLGLLTVVGMLLRRSLMGIIVPGLTPATSALAAELSMILWPTVLFVGLSSILISLIQAEQRFTWPAFVPLVGSGLQLIILLQFGSQLGIRGLAAAVLVNSIAQLVLLLPAAFRKGRYNLLAGWHSSAGRGVIYTLIPVAGGRILLDASILIDRYLGSEMASGSIAQLNYASRIPTVALTLFSAALSITIFPTFAREASEGDLAGLRRTYCASIRYSSLFYFPVVVILCVLSRPLVATLFERGAFRPSDTAVIAAILPWYLVSMAATTLKNISCRVIYALNEPRLMAALNAASAVVYGLVAVFLVRKWGIFGIPIAAAFTGWLFYLAQFVIGFLKTGRVLEAGFLTDIARITLAALAAGAASWSVQRLSTLPDPVLLVVSGLTGLAADAAVLLLLRDPEMTTCRRYIESGFRRALTSW
ncbi:MAG: oligosaccharide flippase family protein [Acidobacteria bacterium]|nr:oligosaccharide flippase family protein [Acidobacteriota bacterium]